MRKRETKRIPIPLGSSEVARRSISEMLHTDALLVCFDYERKCANPCPLCGGIQWSKGQTSETQQIRARHTEPSICLDVEDHDASEALV